MTTLRKIAIAFGLLVVLAGAGLWWLTRGDSAALSLEEVAGTDPVLAEPDPQTIPTVVIAEPVGWKADEAPEAAAGLAVQRFAEGLDHPRVLHALPNGDVLVALTRAPRVEGGEAGLMERIKGWIAGMLLSKAGATGQSPNQIVLLRDGDGDGRAEVRKVILAEGLDSPSGLAWRAGTLYVANHNALLAFPYELGSDKVGGAPR
ncbi:MAG: sorbosone dehydrogenase family protein, partial [Erythrobacter cryptus]